HTGLWPLLLGAIDSEAPLRPWHNDRLAPTPPERADQVDVQAMLSDAWASVQQDWAEFGSDEDVGIAPFDRAWPGLAPASEPRADPDERAIALATSPDEVPGMLSGTGWGPFLGLVAAADGADALSEAGWTSETPCEEATAMLRSWQRRFGVRLCSMGHSTLVVSVAWPPRTQEHAWQVAMEHYAFCPDLGQEYDDFEEYAQGLVDAKTWWMWWD
ncbi:DUF4253 domain-containing protein, partial [Actinomadura fulvescens]